MLRPIRLQGARAQRPVIAVTAIRVHGEPGLDVSLLDDRGAGHVRLVGSRATIATPEDSCDPMSLELARAELAQLASLGRAWRAGRTRFAAYAGDGETVKWRGHWPLLHWAPGVVDAVEITRKHPLFRRMQPRARAYVISSPPPAEHLAGHEVAQVVRSNLEELMAVVLRGPSELCTIVARHRLLVLRRWPRALAAPVRLTLDGRDSMTDAAEEMHGSKAMLIDDRLMAVIEQAVSEKT